MRCRVLGTVELVDSDGRSRPVGSGNQRMVLAALVAHRTRIVSADALIDMLWPDDPPATALQTLRTYVSRLRHHLGDALTSQPAGFCLQLTAAQIDAGQFEAWLAESQASVDPGIAAELLDRALSLRRGPAFGSEADAWLVRGEAMRLDELAIGARIRVASLQLQLGRPAAAIAGAQALVAEVPHLEPAWEVLVRALTAAGRSADALRAFHRAAEQLAELGLEPSAGMCDAQRDALLPVQTRAPSDTRRSRAPHASSSMIGRRRDLDALHALLERSRLVTLVGAGGVGKSRLAAELAHESASRAGQDDGRPEMVWVELASVTRDADVASSVLAALGVAASGLPPIDVVHQLIDLDVVVVLDNAEHVLDGVAAAVVALLAASPRVRVLVTSRERLGVQGEHRWHLGPLRARPDFDGGGGEAAELFVARAAMSDPTTVLDADDPRVAAVVARADGVPLAIEMAAAQLVTMSIEELAHQLAAGVSRLTSPRRGAGRQGSLSSLIEWSERLLGDDELATLHEFSVFAGPVGAADVTGVLGRPDASDTVRSLVERSLIETDRNVEGATSFRMLVMVRDHAADRLRASGRAALLQRRHADWFVDEACRADLAMRAGQHRAARARFDALRDELRVAHRFGRQHDIALAARLSDALYTQARHALFEEPQQWAESTISQVEADPAAAAFDVDVDVDVEAVGAGGWASAAARSIARGNLDEAWVRAQRSLAAAATGRQRMLSLDVAGDIALFDGRLPEAVAAYDEMRALGLAEGDQFYAVLGGVGHAMTITYTGQTADAVDLLDQLVATTPHIGPVSAGWIDYVYGEAFAVNDAPRALLHYDRAIDQGHSAGSWFLESVARVSAGSLQARVGEVGPALSSFTSLVKIWLDMGERTHQRTTLRNLVVLLHRAGRAREAAALLGSVDRGAVATYGDEARRLEEAREWVMHQLGHQQFELLYNAGAARDIPAAATWVIGALRAATL